MRKKLGRSIDLVRLEDPPRASGRKVFDRIFPATTAHKAEALDAVLAALEQAGALRGEADLARARLCLDEALVNAVMHGSQFDAAKRVALRAYARKDGWSVRVEDEGSGFRDEDLPDPEALENLLEEGGRGVHLMRSMLSELSYWRGGRVLVMTQKGAAKQPAAHAADPDSPTPAPQPAAGAARSSATRKTSARKRRSTRKSARA